MYAVTWFNVDGDVPMTRSYPALRGAKCQCTKWIKGVFMDTGYVTSDFNFDRETVLYMVKTKRGNNG